MPQKEKNGGGVGRKAFNLCCNDKRNKYHQDNVWSLFVILENSANNGCDFKHGRFIPCHAS